MVIFHLLFYWVCCPETSFTFNKGWLNKLQNLQTKLRWIRLCQCEKWFESQMELQHIQLGPLIMDVLSPIHFWLHTLTCPCAYPLTCSGFHNLIMGNLLLIISKICRCCLKFFRNQFLILFKSFIFKSLLTNTGSEKEKLKNQTCPSLTYRFSGFQHFLLDILTKFFLKKSQLGLEKEVWV